MSRSGPQGPAPRRPGPGGGGGSGGAVTVSRESPGIRFSGREVRDLLVAWVALGVAFTFFLNPDIARSLVAGDVAVVTALVSGFGVSLVTVGSGFLLHELAHKVAAVRFGQPAEFRADYGMLFLAIMAGLAGFLFAAPGAVYHPRSTSERQNGLIALAGPVTNVVLAVVFVPLVFFGGLLADVGVQGVRINLLLAGFNMIPFGALDGKKVLSWSRVVYVAAAVPTIGLALLAFFGPALL